MTDLPAPTSPLVSVIIPVHDAEAYLEQCLDSVFGQTLRDIEIIAVDDASSDGSPSMLAAAQYVDGRMRVITFPSNRGVSAARNAGLAAARGEFIAFVDADDYIDPPMYEGMLALARSLRCDVVACALEAVDKSGTSLNVTPFPLPAGLRHSPGEMREQLHQAFDNRLLWYPFRSLYRRAVLVHHRLVFDEGVRKGEDSLFNLQALLVADGVACVEDVPYHYRQHGTSATARPLASESENLANLGRAVLAFYSEHRFDDRAWRDFYRHVLRSDLPTALVRLGGQQGSIDQVRALTRLQVVREAFHALPLRSLRVPARVLILLVLAKAQWVGPMIVVLRGRALLSHRRGRG